MDSFLFLMTWKENEIELRQLGRLKELLNFIYLILILSDMISFHAAK